MALGLLFLEKGDLMKGERLGIILFILVVLSSLVSAGVFSDLIFTTVGSSTTEMHGGSIAAGYDFNNDGYEDFVTSAGSDYNVYLYFGSGEALPNMTTSGTRNLTFSGSYAAGFGGRSNQGNKGVSFIDDFNGDSIADIMVSGPTRDVYGSGDAGQVMIFFGSSDLPTTWQETDANITFNGTYSLEMIGDTISGTRDFGDFNGDGYSDILIPTQNNSNGYSGAYVIYGGPSWVSGGSYNITADANITITYNLNTSGTSETVVVGDINNDSCDDFGVSVPDSGNNGRYYSGETYIYFGNQTPSTSINTGDANISINSSLADGALNIHGYVGDWNGDSIDDFLIGKFTFGGPRVYLFYGINDFPSTHLEDPGNYLSNVTFTGDSSDPTFSLVSTGSIGADVNNDGVNDLIFGVPDDLTGGIDGNRTRIFFGMSPATDDLAFSLGDANVTLNGSSGSRKFGYSATVWDYDNDSINEVVVGDNIYLVTPGIYTDEGRVSFYEILDDAVPSFNVTYPLDGTIYTSSWLMLNVTAEDTLGTGSMSGMDSCWFTNVTGVNVSFTCSDNGTLFLASGSNTFYVYANDSVNNVNSTSFSITYDDTAPALEVITPVNETTYTVSTNMSLNVSVTDSGIGLDSCWFTNVTGQNSTFTCLTNTSFLGIDCQQNNITAYANDSSNFINVSDNVFFTLDVECDAGEESTATDTTEFGSGGGSGGSTVSTPVVTPVLDEVKIIQADDTVDAKFVVSLTEDKLPFTVPVNVVTEKVDEVKTEVTKEKASVSLISDGSQVGKASVSFSEKLGVSVPNVDMKFKAYDLSKVGEVEVNEIKTNVPTGAFVTSVDSLYLTKFHIILGVLLFGLVCELGYGYYWGLC